MFTWTPFTSLKLNNNLENWERKQKLPKCWNEGLQQEDQSNKITSQTGGASTELDMLDVEFLTFISSLVKNWGTVSFTVIIVLNPKASEKKKKKNEEKAQSMKKIDLFNDKLKQKKWRTSGRAATLLRLHMRRNGEMIGLNSLNPWTKNKTKGLEGEDLPHKWEDSGTNKWRGNKIKQPNSGRKETFRRTTTCFFSFKLQTLKFSHNFYNCLLMFVFKIQYKNR